MEHAHELTAFQLQLILHGRYEIEHNTVNIALGCIGTLTGCAIRAGEAGAEETGDCCGVVEKAEQAQSLVLEPGRALQLELEPESELELEPAQMYEQELVSICEQQQQRHHGSSHGGDGNNGS